MHTISSLQLKKKKVININLTELLNFKFVFLKNDFFWTHYQHWRTKTNHIKPTHWRLDTNYTKFILADFNRAQSEAGILKLNEWPNKLHQRQISHCLIMRASRRFISSQGKIRKFMLTSLDSPSKSSFAMASRASWGRSSSPSSSSSSSNCRRRRNFF